MAGTFLIATALLAQSATTVTAVPPGADHVDVGYSELSSGRPAQAIEVIRANDALSSDDPAALINLGSAYVMLGDKAKARECYRAAIISDERYELQLANGSWMDSRRAARVAVDMLASGRTLALR